MAKREIARITESSDEKGRVRITSVDSDVIGTPKYDPSTGHPMTTEQHRAYTSWYENVGQERFARAVGPDANLIIYAMRNFGG